MLQAGLTVLTGVVLMYGYAAWRTQALRAHQQEVNVQYVAALARLNEVSAKLPMRHANPRSNRRCAIWNAASRRCRSSATWRGAISSRAAPVTRIPLVALARQSTAGLWITGLTLNDAGDSVVLAGRTQTPELVPGYLQRMANEKTLAGQQFEIFQMTRPVRTPADEVKHTEAVLESYIDFEVRSKPAEKQK